MSTRFRAIITVAWWRHQMKTFSALLAICAGNSTVTGEFPAQRPVTRNFDVFFDMRLNTRLSEQSRGWWFETPSRPLWLHYNGSTMGFKARMPTRTYNLETGLLWALNSETDETYQFVIAADQLYSPLSPFLWEHVQWHCLHVHVWLSSVCSPWVPQEPRHIHSLNSKSCTHVFISISRPWCDVGFPNFRFNCLWYWIVLYVFH